MALVTTVTLRRSDVNVYEADAIRIICEISQIVKSTILSKKVKLLNCLLLYTLFRFIDSSMFKGTYYLQFQMKALILVGFPCSGLHREVPANINSSTKCHIVAEESNLIGSFLYTIQNINQDLIGENTLHISVNVCAFFFKIVEFFKVKSKRFYSFFFV